MVNPLNGPQVRDFILKQGYSTTEAAAFSWGNITEEIVNTGKGVLTAQCGNRVGSGAYKATKDFGRGDLICGTLCCISIGCEVVSGVLVWCPIPSKITTVSALKATSIGYQKFRDLCAADPSSPLC
jgi:hypothetical protein